MLKLLELSPYLFKNHAAAAVRKNVVFITPKISVEDKFYNAREIVIPLLCSSP